MNAPSSKPALAFLALMGCLLLTGWANATEAPPKPSRCTIVETLVTTPDGAQHIRRKVSCEYTAEERAALAKRKGGGQ